MFERLNIKLLLPMVAVGLVFILGLFMADDTLSKTMVLAIVFAMLILQIIAGFLFSEKLLASRLVKLKQYLDLVVSVDQAPESPLKDTVKDDIGTIVNQLSDFIGNLAEVITELRAESEALHQGSEQLANQMVDSVKAVDESANQIEQMAQSIEEVASTSSILSESASQVSDTTSQVMVVLEQGKEFSHTSRKTIEAIAIEVDGMA